MYFHPPTLDPGPVATLIGFVTLVFLMAQPLLTRPLARRLGEPTEPGRPSPLMRLHHLGACLSFVEVLAAAAFVGTARVLTPADIGITPPRLQAYDPDVPSPLADDPVSWIGTAVVLVWAALFVAALLVARHLEGARPAEPAMGGIQLADLTDAEVRWMVWYTALGGLCTTAVFFVVVYPLVTVLVGPLAAAVTIALLLGGQQWGNGFQQMFTMAVYGLMLTLSHAFLTSGSLLVPVAIWCVFAYFYGRLLRRQRRRLSHAARPMEVTMLDAGGDPVRRPGR
ncbi:hypothetical protein A6A08_17515 [Nocardiopsis sp. TSRI0078]|uniref:hypothetical protein n=1 Tax=unclassified Nocardiopsis TaxID=2649073 RepID=UPI00093F853D|nr:hypothetical protein [Nocardiopsis sp. TSRI0078]OKI12357.1 hypothetical protein A6A08_17515 [Nocardiopsis sp. TSRI0078]